MIILIIQNTGVLIHERTLTISFLQGLDLCHHLQLWLYGSVVLGNQMSACVTSLSFNYSGIV